MRGYAMGAEDAAVIYPERVNHLGVPLGKIERVERGFARFTPCWPSMTGTACSCGRRAPRTRT